MISELIRRKMKELENDDTVIMLCPQCGRDDTYYFYRASNFRILKCSYCDFSKYRTLEKHPTEETEQETRRMLIKEWNDDRKRMITEEECFEDEDCEDDDEYDDDVPAIDYYDDTDDGDEY